LIIGGRRADEYPVWPKGNQFEDFSVGQRLVHHWGRTVTAADNMLFSTALCQWLPLYLNVEYAREAGHRDVVVNPMLVLSVLVGLSVEDLSEAGGPFLGLDDCEFACDVYPGDTLSASSVVVACRASRSRPRVGIVTWRTTGRNQRGETVASFTRANFVAKRETS
jgi:acyl dehydratase